MDNKVYNEAVENISLIKEVINQTSKSFVGFSKIFILWGVLFSLNSIIQLIMIMNKERVMEITMKYPLIGYIFPVGIIVAIAVLIYRNVSRKIPLVGLEKHLMKIWSLILMMNLIPQRIFINVTDLSMDVNQITVESNNFSTMHFSLGIALITTYLFTGYKKLKYAGFTYIVISLAVAYFIKPTVDISLIQILLLFAWPLTFLFTGLFLKSQHARGN